VAGPEEERQTADMHHDQEYKDAAPAGRCMVWSMSRGGVSGAAVGIPLEAGGLRLPGEVARP
jgi:hypothetical protein